MRLFLILFSVDDPIGKYILDKIVTIAVVFQVFLSFLSFFLTQVGDSRVGNENFGALTINVTRPDQFSLAQSPPFKRKIAPSYLHGSSLTVP